MERMQPKRNLALWVLGVVCAVSVLGMAVALLRKPQQTAAAFAPPPFEAAAVSGTPQAVPETLAYGTLDAQAYTLAVCAAPVVQTNAAQLYFTNPADNAVWLKVRIYTADGALLGESGLLRPGEYVQAVSLDPVPTQDTPVVLKVMAYEPDTYHSAGAVTLSTTLSVS